jgi:hypothetical protein
MLPESDLMIATSNAQKYEIMDATDKEIVVINIYRDAQFNYCIDRTRMVNAILKEANMTGCRDEHLKYPMSFEHEVNKLIMSIPKECVTSLHCVVTEKNNRLLLGCLC